MAGTTGNSEPANDNLEFTFMTEPDDVAPETSASSDGGEDPHGTSGRSHTTRRRRRMSVQHIRRIRRKRRIRRLFVGLGILLLLLVAAMAWFVQSVLTVKNEVQQAVALVPKVQSSLAAGDAQSLKNTMREFSAHTDAAYAQTSSLLWKVASRTPYYGSDITAARTAVTVMENISSQAMPALQQASGH